MVIQCRMEDGDFISKDNRHPVGIINRASEFFVHQLTVFSYFSVKIELFCVLLFLLLVNPMDIVQKLDFFFFILKWNYSVTAELKKNLLMEQHAV